MVLSIMDASWKRQDGVSNGGSSNDDGGWWWSSAGYAVRYAIVLILLFAFIFFFVFGHFHAQRRIRQGRPLLPYHRWMMRRTYQQQQRVPQHQYQPVVRPRQETYDMPGYPPPPPAYNHGDAPPPVYQPPEGGSKAMADQHIRSTSYEGGLNGFGGASSSRQ